MVTFNRAFGTWPSSDLLTKNTETFELTNTQHHESHITICGGEGGGKFEIFSSYFQKYLNI